MIEKEFDIMPDVQKGARGLFEVRADGEVIYSNRNEGGRLPRNEEVIEKLRGYRRPSQDSAPESGCG